MVWLSRPYPSNVLKAVFPKSYLVHSLILCPKCGLESRHKVSAILVSGFFLLFKLQFIAYLLRNDNYG